MFTGAVNHALHFINLHSDRKGCLSSDLGEFIETDVLPLLGWAPNPTLRDTVAYLVLRDYYENVVCYELPTKYRETIHVKTQKAYYHHTKLDTLVSVKRSEKPLTYDEIMKELNGATIAWTAHPPPPQEGGAPLKLLRICATVEFQSSFLGLPLHLESILHCSRFMMVAATAGLHHVSYPPSELSKITEKPPLIPTGLREMRRQQWVFPSFIWTNVDRTVQCLYFPFYAMPTTAADRGKSNSLHERQEDPLAHYFARKRQEMGFLDCVVFDLNVVVDVIRNSPEQQMLWEDAVHAILAAHNLSITYKSMNKYTKRSIAQMCAAAGLVREYASVPMLGKVVRVSILRAPDCSVTGRRLDANDVPPPDALDEAIDGDPLLAEEEEVEEEMDDKGLPIKKKSNKNERKLSMSRVMEYPVYLSPHFPFNVQAAQEAERRPFSITVALPHIRCDRVHRSLNNYMEMYVASHRLEKGYVVIKNSKSFSLIYTPPGFLGVAPNEKDELSTTALPDGLSRFAVEKTLHALEASPHQALSMPALSAVLDTKTLSLRVVPYLKSIGKITTTSIREGRLRRVGIVALAGRTLTEEEKMEVVGPSVARNLTPTVHLDHIPDPGNHTASAPQQPCASRTLQTIDRIMIIRNGYARLEDRRTGRLHLELWKQWYDRRAAAEGTAPLEFNARIVLENMSLSTFCIVVGFAAGDLATYMQSETQRLFEWDTPLKSLPPSVYEQCLQQSTTPLLRALSLLQERELITSEVEIAPFSTQALHHFRFFLEEQGVYNTTSTFVFYAPSYTPSSTAYMVLRYWTPKWVRWSHKEIPAVTRLQQAGCALTVPQLIALSTALRVNPAVLTETFYQSGGWLGPQVALRARPTAAKTHTRKLPGRKRMIRSQSLRDSMSMRGSTFSRKLQLSMRDATGAITLRQLLHLVNRRSRDRYLQSGIRMLLDAASRGVAAYNRLVSHEVHLSLLGAALKALLPPDTLNLVKGSLSSSAYPQEVQEASVQSVYSPDVRLPVGAKLAQDEEARADPKHRHHVRAPVTDPAAEAEAVALVMDCLRSVLLSDASHYDATVATSVLTAFPPRIIAKARAELQSAPSFRIAKGQTRVPLLALRSSASFTVDRLVRQAPSSCANMWLLHNLYATAAQQCAVFAPPAPIGALFPPTPPALVCVEAQETVDMATAVKAVGSGIRLLAKVQLPSLAWPAAAARAEAERELPTEAPRKRRRDAADGDEDEDGENGWQSDAEAEEERIDASHLYPARVISCGKEELRLAAIPVDAPPQEEEKAYVQLCMKHIRDNAPLPSPLGYLPAYPSIFYHVDGAFHRFVWCAYLVELYHYLLCVPGVSHSQVSAAMTESGLAGQRDFAAAMRYLVDNGAVRRRQTTRATTCSPFGGHEVDASAVEWAYEATVLPEGLWNMIDLDSCASSSA